VPGVQALHESSAGPSAASSLASPTAQFGPFGAGSVDAFALSQLHAMSAMHQQQQFQRPLTILQAATDAGKPAESAVHSSLFGGVGQSGLGPLIIQSGGAAVDGVVDSRNSKGGTAALDSSTSAGQAAGLSAGVGTSAGAAGAAQMVERKVPAGAGAAGAGAGAPVASPGLSGLPGLKVPTPLELASIGTTPLRRAMTKPVSFHKETLYRMEQYLLNLLKTELLPSQRTYEVREAVRAEVERALRKQWKGPSAPAPARASTCVLFRDLLRGHRPSIQLVLCLFSQMSLCSCSVRRSANCARIAATSI
jgi:hypothetical protein